MSLGVYDLSGNSRNYNLGVPPSAPVISVATDASIEALGFRSVLNASVGALGDGSTDDTAAFTRLAALGGKFFVPNTGSPYKVGPVIYAKPTVFEFEAGAYISPIFATSGAETLFKFTGVNSGMIRPKIVGAGAVTVSGTKSLIIANPSATGFFIENPDISNCKWSDGNRGLTNAIRTNGIYVLGNNSRVIGGVIDGLLGPGIFSANVSNLQIRGVKFNNVLWYNINLDEDVANFDIDDCTFSCDDTYGTYWGGLVNIMSQPTTPAPAVVRNGRIRDCKFIDAVVSYGAVVRLQSVYRVDVDGCTFHGISSGSLAASANVEYVALDWRYAGAPTNQDNGPWAHVNIINNHAVANNGIHRFVYAKCSQVGVTRNASKFLTVRGNTAESVDSSNNFDSFCGVHGLYGGIEYVNITDNIATVKTASGTPVPGAIGIVSNDAQGQINHVSIDNNKLEDIGTINTSITVQVGIFIQGYADQVAVGAGNKCKNFLRAFRTAANVTNVSGGDGVIGEACRYENLLVVIPNDGPASIMRVDVKPVSGIFHDGDIIYKRNQSPSTALGWVCTTAGGAVTGVWASGQTYVAALWYAGSTGKVYELITAGGGTTSVEPTHTAGDVTGADGYVWRHRAAATANIVALASNAAS